MGAWRSPRSHQSPIERPASLEGQAPGQYARSGDATSSRINPIPGGAVRGMFLPARRAKASAWLALAAALAGAPGAVGCGKKPVTFEPAEIERHSMLAGVSPGFLLGAATSAYQIEGGNQNDWTDWEAGHYPDGQPHVSDGSAAARYREMLMALLAARPHPIRPMLNLYHFTLPRWVAARGGWEWSGAPQAFAAFAARAADAFGDLVDLWCTLNEPNVYVVKGYMAGQWPPGARDPARGARELARLLEAHGLAAAAL